MTMTATLVQSAPAMMGQATTFVVTVLNSSGSAVNVNSIQPICTTLNGSPATSCILGPITVPPELGSAQVGGSQLNVPVLGNSSQAFSFQASFYGPAVSGAPCQPSMQYQVSCSVQTSDNTSFITPPLAVNLNQPVFGLAQGSPPNASAPAPALCFANPANSALL